jgi:DNA repair protein RecO (recombination protein O)
MASVICKTEGIVLRTALFSETSCVVNWLTPEFGRIATLIKGAFRPRGGFIGQFDSFFTCEILFYHRFGGEVHIAREVSALKTRDAFRDDWRAAACASYLTDLVARASPQEAPHPEAFRLLDELLDELATNSASATLVFWFELRLLSALGLAPQFTRCIRCHRELSPQDRGIKFQASHGGLLCGTCGKTASRDVAAIAPDVMATMSSWQRSVHPHAARRTQCGARQVDEIENLLGAFLTYHLDMALPGRRICFDLLSRRPGGGGDGSAPSIAGR